MPLPATGAAAAAPAEPPAVSVSSQDDLRSGAQDDVPGHQLRFEDCVIDTRRRELQVGRTLVPLQPRIYSLLCFLAQHAGQVISKEALLQSVWPTSHVTDAVLATAMLKLRRAINDTSRKTPVLVTVRGVGYRFDALVRVEAISGAPRHEIPSAGSGILVTSTPAASGGTPPSGPGEHTGPVMRVAVLPFTNDTADTLQDGPVQGLTTLLYGRLAQARHTRMLSLNTSLSWRPVGAAADVITDACKALGADWAVSCRLWRSPEGLGLSAQWGRPGEPAAVWWAQGPNAAELTEELAARLLAVDGPLGARPARPERAGSRVGPMRVQSGPTFWEGQLDRVTDLERRGMSEQALAVLGECLVHLPLSASLCLLHGRLLRQRMDFAAAGAALLQGLALAEHSEPQTTAQLLAEQLRLLHLQGDIAAAQQTSARAMTMLAAGQAPLSSLPVVLVASSELDFSQGEYRTAAQKADRACAVAHSTGDTETEVSAAICLARAVYMQGDVQRAHDALQMAVNLAHSAGLTRIEADAYMRLSFQENCQWRHRSAVGFARRAVTLAAACGDLASWHRAQVRLMMCLIDQGQTEDASRLFDEHFQAHGTRPSNIEEHNRNNVRWLLDWRQGRAEAAVQRLQETLAQAPPSAVDRRRRLSYRLMINLLCLGRHEQAAEVLASQAPMHYLTREVHLQAAFAMGRADRAQARLILRTAWLSQPSNDTEAWHTLESLAWLLLEDDQTEDLAALAPDIALLSDEQPTVALLRYRLAVRSGALPWDRTKWQALVGANSGLVHRHNWMLALDLGRQGMARAPELPMLLSDACV